MGREKRGRERWVIDSEKKGGKIERWGGERKILQREKDILKGGDQ